MKRVFIIGSEGTTGLRLRERLEKRKGIELLSVCDELRKDPNELTRIIAQADFTFLCLPDAAAREMAALAAGTNTRLIDTSTAHRTDAAWVYGFPELSSEQKTKIATSNRVTIPGCHASGFIALVTPLIQAGLLPKTAQLACTSLSGYSGGGKKMIAQYQSPERSAEYESTFLYAMSQQHKHLPEMTAHTGLSKPPIFMPVVGDYYAGMVVSVALDGEMLTKPASPASLIEIYKNHYESSPMLQVAGDSPAGLYANILSGRDDMEIFVSGTESQIQLTARFDNLGKGASGAAIQCFNLMCGEAESEGLVIS